MSNLIIFDTNCYWDNYNLDNLIFDTTLKFCRNSEDYEFVLPIVIKDEVVNNFKKQLKEKYENINSYVSWYKKYTSRKFEIASHEEFEEDAKGYIARFEQLIRVNQIEQIDYPDYSHKEIVTRNAKQLKPFSGNDAGYKDTLIWLNIIDRLKATSDVVIYISKNKSDFGKNDSLHKDLLKELDDNGIERDRVQYFSKQETFFEEVITPQLPVLDAIDQIRNNEYEDFNFDEYIDNHIYEWLSENQNEIDLSYISQSLERPYISSIDEVELIELSDGKRIDGNSVLLEYNVGVNALCDVLIDRHRAIGEQLSEAINIFHYNFNPSFMEGEVYLYIGATLFIIFDPENKEVLTTQLENIVAQDYR